MAPAPGEIESPSIPRSVTVSHVSRELASWSRSFWITSTLARAVRKSSDNIPQSIPWISTRRSDTRLGSPTKRKNIHCILRSAGVPDGDHPLHAKFARLTQQEEKDGLLDDSATIGTKEGWQAKLNATSFALLGHRLVGR
jgi:hypothetical protein